MVVKKRLMEMVVVLAIVSLFWLLSLLAPQRGITGYVTTDDAQAGNVTKVNISVTKTSAFWQGLFGEVFEDPTSSEKPSITAVGGQMTEFNLTLPCLGEEIYASINQDISLQKVQAGNNSDLNTYLQLSSSHQESGSQVFTTTSSFSIFSSNISPVPTTYTLVHNSPNNTSFDLGLLKESGDFVFVTHLSFDTIGFDNKTHDYQMMIPVNQSSLKYFFFSDCTFLAAPAPGGVVAAPALPPPRPAARPAALPVFLPLTPEEVEEIRSVLEEIVKLMIEKKAEETEITKMVQMLERGEIFQLDVREREINIITVEASSLLPQFIKKTSNLLKSLSVADTINIVKEEAGVTRALPLAITITNYLVRDPQTKEKFFLAKVDKKITAEEDWSTWEVVEAVPKTIAPTADDLIFITQKPQIVEKDPVMKWTFLDVTKGEKKDISYLIINKSLEIYEAVYFTAGTKPAIEKPVVEKPIAFPLAKFVSVVILLIIVIMIVIVWRLSLRKKKSRR